MNFISKLFTLFAVLNLLSLNSALADSNPVDSQSSAQEVMLTKESTSDEKNNGKAVKSEHKGMVSTYEKKMAFSYEIDDNGKLINVKDLYKDNVDINDKSKDGENKNVNVCSYHQITSFEISDYNDNIIIQLVGREQKTVKESLEAVKCDEQKDNNESSESGVQNSISTHESENEKSSENMKNNDRIDEDSEAEVKNNTSMQDPNEGANENMENNDGIDEDSEIDEESYESEVM